MHLMTFWHQKKEMQTHMVVKWTIERYTYDPLDCIQKKRVSQCDRGKHTTSDPLAWCGTVRHVKLEQVYKLIVIQ